MKTLLSILALSILLVSCGGRADIDEAVVVEQINISNSEKYKYEVKLKTRVPDGGEVYYHTNFRFQVGDSLVSYYENFDSKNTALIKVQGEIANLKRQNDSLINELKSANYYLGILKEKLIISTSK